LVLRRLTRIHRFVTEEPGQWCWTRLIVIAVYGVQEAGWGALRDAKAGAAECRQESISGGRCYCGRFAGGVWEASPGIEGCEGVTR
jgi:hypothetical protein